MEEIEHVLIDFGTRMSNLPFSLSMKMDARIEKYGDQVVAIFRLNNLWRAALKSSNDNAYYYNHEAYHLDELRNTLRLIYASQNKEFPLEEYKMILIDITKKD